jgi:hypothetical protein
MKRRYWFTVLLSAAIMTAWAAQQGHAQTKTKTAPPRAPVGQTKAPNQPPAPTASPRSGAGAPATNGQPARQPVATVNTADEIAAKRAILESPRWQRMMFEFKQWLSVQKIYNQQQVDELKRNFNQHVAEASHSELQFILDDMETKFQIIDSQPAQDARAWMAHYLSVVTQKKRDELLKDVPNIATMTAAQLQQEVMKIERKKAAAARNQAAFDQARQAQVDAQLKQNQQSQQAYIQQQNLAANSGYTSPYRAPAANNGNPPFANYKTGPSMEYYIGSFGRFGLIFNPSSY